MAKGRQRNWRHVRSVELPPLPAQLHKHRQGFVKVGWAKCWIRCAYLTYSTPFAKAVYLSKSQKLCTNVFSLANNHAFPALTKENGKKRRKEKKELGCHISEIISKVKTCRCFKWLSGEHLITCQKGEETGIGTNNSVTPSNEFGVFKGCTINYMDCAGKAGLTIMASVGTWQY